MLELGSGTGVVGIAAACLGAAVLATDVPEVLSLLRGNMARNAGLVAAAGGSVAAAALNWEVPEAAAEVEATLSGRQADWVLGADLVYSLAPVAPLVRTLAALVGASVGSGSSSAAAGASQQERHARLLLAHKCRHEEVDSALLGGLRASGVPLRVVARDSESRITVYGNREAAAALGL